MDDLAKQKRVYCEEEWAQPRTLWNTMVDGSGVKTGSINGEKLFPVREVRV